MNYPTYLKHEESNTVVKIVSENQAFLVQVIGFKSGAYKHLRQKVVFYDEKELTEFIAKYDPADEEDYKDRLKDLFIIEKKDWEVFLKMYPV